jgi:hypothetical protein
VSCANHGEHGVEPVFFEGAHDFIAHMVRDVDDGERIVTARELAILWAGHRRRFTTTGDDEQGGHENRDEAEQLPHGKSESEQGARRT